MAYIDLDEINRLHPKLTAKYPLSFANGISAAINEINRLPNDDVVPKSEVERLEKEIKALLAFKDYFSDLYGHGLEVANWHENGELEDFDIFYESAVDEYEAELKKKYEVQNDG